MTVDSFVKANVEIVSVRMKEGSKLCGLALYDLQKKFQAKVLICAVERGDIKSVYIASGHCITLAQMKAATVYKKTKSYKPTFTDEITEFTLRVVTADGNILYYTINETAPFVVDRQA